MLVKGFPLLIKLTDPAFLLVCFTIALKGMAAPLTQKLLDSIEIFLLIKYKLKYYQNAIILSSQIHVPWITHKNGTGGLMIDTRKMCNSCFCKKKGGSAVVAIVFSGITGVGKRN